MVQVPNVAKLNFNKTLKENMNFNKTLKETYYAPFYKM